MGPDSQHPTPPAEALRDGRRLRLQRPPTSSRTVNAAAFRRASCRTGGHLAVQEERGGPPRPGRPSSRGARPRRQARTRRQQLPGCSTSAARAGLGGPARRPGLAGWPGRRPRAAACWPSTVQPRVISSECRPLPQGSPRPAPQLRRLTSALPGRRAGPPRPGIGRLQPQSASRAQLAGRPGVPMTRRLEARRATGPRARASSAGRRRPGLRPGAAARRRPARHRSGTVSRSRADRRSGSRRVGQQHRRAATRPQRRQQPAQVFAGSAHRVPAAPSPPPGPKRELIGAARPPGGEQAAREQVRDGTGWGSRSSIPAGAPSAPQQAVLRYTTHGLPEWPSIAGQRRRRAGTAQEPLSPRYPVAGDLRARYVGPCPRPPAGPHRARRQDSGRLSRPRSGQPVSAAKAGRVRPRRIRRRIAGPAGGRPPPGRELPRHDGAVRGAKPGQPPGIVHGAATARAGPGLRW